MNKVTELVLQSQVLDLEWSQEDWERYYFNVYGRANAVLNLVRRGMGKEDGYTQEDLIEVLEGILEK